MAGKEDGRQGPAGPGPGAPAPSASEFAGIGLQFAAAVVLFLLVGQWLDRKLGTSPVFVIVGVFVGASAAFYSMYRKISAAQREMDRQRDLNRR